MQSNKLAPMQAWIAEPLPNDVMRSLLRLARTEGVVRIAVMPDVHLAQGVCIGTVFASESLVLPEAVGSDIGCGMAAMSFDAEADIVNASDHSELLMQGLSRLVPANRHPLGGSQGWMPESISDRRLSQEHLIKEARRTGTTQLGTLGRGNHFLELQSDDDGRLWVMVHSGSRGIGLAIARYHLERAERTNTGFLSFKAETSEGQAYLADAAWAVEYARQNRQRIIHSAATLIEELLGAQAESSSYLDSVHNLVRLEEHDGRRLLVHRKGANSAKVGEPSIIPGSMGTESFHVVGRGNVEALSSCSHGAGRAMSRSQARNAVSERRLLKEMEGVRFDRSKARFLRDEAPSAYKDINTVMRAQRDLIKRVRKLRPVLNHKGR